MHPTNQAESQINGWRCIATRGLGVITLAIVACGIYWPTLRYEMIFDDVPGIVDNESIRSLTPLFGPPDGYGPLNPQPNTPVTARPLVSLTFALNYHFGQVDPLGYRLTHLVLHVIVALILWAVVAATLAQPIFNGRFVKNRHALSFAAALLWMVHPAHTETVVYLTQRTELLMGLFYLLTIYLAIRFWDSKRSVMRIVWCAAAVVSSVCGMLSKEMMASVPAMVLIYEWTFVGGSFWTITKRSWMLHLGLVLSWLPLVAIYASGYSTPLGGFGNTISAPDWWLTQSNSFFVYWRLLFAPWPLLLHYHVPTLTSFSEAWPGVLGITIYAFATVFFLWRRAAIGFALLWFFAVLSPTLIVPLPHEEISERRLYVPLLAMLPYLSVGAFVLIQRFTERMTGTRDAMPSSEKAPLGAFTNFAIGNSLPILFATAFVIVSAVTVPRLQGRRTIWLDVLKHQPDNTFAISCQGSVEFNDGELERGLKKIQYAFDTDPEYDVFSSALVNALNSANLHERLLTTCLLLYKLSPSDPICAYNLASAMEKNGLYDNAVRQYREVIKLDPLHWESHSALATLLAERNQNAESLKHFEIATEIKPDFINCMNLMTLYINTQQPKKALLAAKKLAAAARKEKSPEVVEQFERGLKELESRLQD